MIADLAAAGLGGVEVGPPRPRAGGPGAPARARRRARPVTTGSSDYHGTNKTTPVARRATDPDAFEALLAAGTGARPSDVLEPSVTPATVGIA